MSFSLKKFLVPRWINLKRFDKNIFKSGKMVRSASSGKDKEFGVTVLAQTLPGLVLDLEQKIFIVHVKFLESLLLTTD